MTPAQFRRAALALPEVVEGEHHGHPDFRAHGRVFASLHPDGERAMVKVPAAVQQQLVALAGGVAAPAAGAWGRAGCTMLRLAAMDASRVEDALAQAWQFAATAGQGRSSRTGSGRAAGASRRTSRRGPRST
jgi:hypothetical protein